MFLSFFVWWIVLNDPLSRGSSEVLQLWGATYQMIAWYGAIMGLVIARRWGDYKSMVGQAVLAFSLGLLCQSFGQTAYSFYVYFWKIPIPYPSLGDFGFFGSIPFYMYGAYMLSKISGVKISLKLYGSKIQAIIVPAVLLGLSYFLFLKDYVFDWTQPVKTLLDFGYPLGQAVYVSIAILAFILSRKILGGIMRLPMLFFIAALIAQYLSDFVFLIQAQEGSFYPGGINDLMYAASYALMAIALCFIGDIHTKIKET